MKRGDREQTLTVPELEKAAGSRYENAPEIWRQYVAIKSAGGRAKIAYSPNGGYRLYEGQGE